MDTPLLISSVLLWIVLLSNLLLTLALIRRVNKIANGDSQELPPMLQPGDQIPEFNAETVDGRVITQADYLGHETALVFISPTCGPCREEMPTLKSLYSRAKLNGVDLTLVSLGQALETQNMVEEFEIEAPVLVAPLGNSPFGKDYKVSATPSYYLIDANGKVKRGGALDETWQATVKSWKAET